jgi:hypothetical protein
MQFAKDTLLSQLRTNWIGCAHAQKSEIAGCAGEDIWLVPLAECSEVLNSQSLESFQVHLNSLAPSPEHPSIWPVMSKRVTADGAELSSASPAAVVDIENFPEG